MVVVVAVEVVVAVVMGWVLGIVGGRVYRLRLRHRRRRSMGFRWAISAISATEETDSVGQARGGKGAGAAG